MKNPYRTNAKNTTASRNLPSRRPATRYLYLSMILMATAGIPFAIALVLLNQQFQVIPTTTGVFDITINGIQVSNEAVAQIMLLAALAFYFAAGVALKVGTRNRRHNARLMGRESSDR